MKGLEIFELIIFLLLKVSFVGLVLLGLVGIVLAWFYTDDFHDAIMKFDIHRKR